MVIGCSKVPHQKVFSFCAAHITEGSGSGKFFPVDFHDIGLFFDGNMPSRELCQFLLIIHLPVMVAGMVVRGKDFADKVVFEFSHFFIHPYPDSGSGSRVVSGTVAVVKSEVVCFPFLFLGDLNVVDLPHQGVHRNIGCCAASHGFRCNGCSNDGSHFLLGAFEGMVLHSMSHFVSNDEGYFINVVRNAEKPGIDGHDMSQSAGSVETFVIIQKVQEWLVLNGGIMCCHAFCQVIHESIKHGIMVFIIIDAHAVFHFLVIGLSSFFCIIDIVNVSIDFFICHGTAEYRSYDTSPVHCVDCCRCCCTDSCGADEPHGDLLHCFSIHSPAPFFFAVFPIIFVLLPERYRKSTKPLFGAFPKF